MTSSVNNRVIDSTGAQATEQLPSAPKRFLIALALGLLACGKSGAPADGASPATPVPVVSIDPIIPPVRVPITPTIPDKRTPTQIAAAACTRSDGSWGCATPKPKTFAASSGSTPVTPASWTVPAWFIDPQNTSTAASDNNSCTTALAPCLTWGEINVHRWGCAGNPDQCPILAQATTITWMSSQTVATDPVSWNPQIQTTGLVDMVGAAPTSVTATFTLNTAKNRTLGANAILSGSFSAGAPAAGKLLQNVTHPSRAWILDLLSGSNYNITQPLVAQTPGGTISPAEVDTWTTGDTVNILTPVSINLVSSKGTVGVGTQLTFYQLQVSSTSGFNVTYIDSSNALTVLQEVSFSNNALYTYGGQGTYCSNCLPASGFVAQAIVFLAGGTTATSTLSGSFNNFLDGDYISGAGLNIFGGTTSIGFMFMGPFGGVTIQNGSSVSATTFYGGHVIYGTGATVDINIENASHFFLNGGTFTSDFTAPGLVTGIKLNGIASATCNTGADPGVLHNATTTPANLDTACGAGTGLGGVGFNLGGGSVSNVGP